ncbi:MAG: EamA family transporter [Acidobacteria bacterium]|nr:EamA family transporter [Acidobacteriota bacterium]
MRVRRPAVGAAAVSCAALLFGLNASTVKVIIGTGISSEQLVLFRTTFTAIVAGLVLLLTNRKAFRLEKREVPVMLLYGITGIALMQWSYANAVTLLPISVALLIEYTAIVIVPIVSYFLFKEKLRGRLWFGIALVLSGLAIVSNIWDSDLDPVGVAWACMAAICVSIYFLVGEHTQKSRDPMSTLFYTFLVASIFWLVMNLLNPQELISLEESMSLAGNLAAIDWPIWLALIWLGVMGSFVPMLLDYIALGNLSATAVGVIATAETIFASAFAWVWLNESMTTIEVIGGLIVVCGIIIAETSRSSHKV